MSASSESSCAWSPQPGPQSDAIDADWCPELFYGGAAGGGKSDFLLGDFLQDVDTYGEHWRGVIFRRTYPELEELQARAFEIYPQTGAVWSSQNRTWTWPGGAVLRMRYLESDPDASRYQGHQYTWEGWDELTQWPTPYAYRYLRARLRSAHDVPRKRIRAAGNPGGPGHQWVKSYFVDPAPGGYVPILDEKTQQERMFVPSRLSDNKLLLQHDPAYANRLRGLGSPEMVRAWLDGDWNVIQGAFFPEFSTDRHVVRPHAIPGTWLRFRAGDWGSAAPFAVYWIAVAGDDDIYPRGALVVYREWYGCTGEPNQGIKLDAQEFGRQGALKDGDDKIAYGVLDPSAFKEDGGPSIAERMMVAGWKHWQRADNQRIPGWDQVRARLAGDGDGRSMLYVFDTCTHLIRTLPALQHDEHKPEDVDTESEDHAGDALRYGCMSRPWIKKVPTFKPRPSVVVGGKSTMTLDEAYKRADRMRRGQGGRI